jgi:Mn2+/Fe2+ NRAMP family transporter
MTPPETQTATTTGSAATGPIAAALLAAGLGCFSVGLTTVLAAASQPLNKAFSLYTPSGALSGEAALSVAIWLAAWLLLGRRWRHSAEPFNRVLAAAYVLLFLGLAMTFPPIVHILAGL